MSKLVPPHGGKGLVCCLLHGSELEAEIEKAAQLKKISISGRENGDLIMMGIGGFSPLNGFMNRADWKGVCENMQLSDGTFWPVPVTLSCSEEDAAVITTGDEIALENSDGVIMATMKVTEKYEMTEADKRWECEKIFMGKGEDSVDGKFWEVAIEDHPGLDIAEIDSRVVFGCHHGNKEAANIQGGICVPHYAGSEAGAQCGVAFSSQRASLGRPIMAHIGVDRRRGGDDQASVRRRVQLGCAAHHIGDDIDLRRAGVGDRPGPDCGAIGTLHGHTDRGRLWGREKQAMGAACVKREQWRNIVLDVQLSLSRLDGSQQGGCQQGQN